MFAGRRLLPGAFNSTLKTPTQPLVPRLLSFYFTCSRINIWLLALLWVTDLPLEALSVFMALLPLAIDQGYSCLVVRLNPDVLVKR